ncbi:CHASE2 domain-containing protein [Pseudoxanthomonas sp. 10H]|uniref:CHASE2 domain-containing protein n=1 Tax=Pseudoxanthomonas sp. 10H TaxID=3242729 RepID=UPI0035584F4A
MLRAPVPVSAQAPGSRLRRWTPALAAGVLAALLGVSGLTAALDDVAHLALSSPRQPLPAPPALVLGIDAATPWPWSNARVADLVERLRGAGVRGVALDLPMDLQASTGDPAGAARLARAILDNRVVVGVPLATEAGGLPRAQLPPVEFAEAARLGHVLLPRGPDGRIRYHLPHQLTADGVRWPSLPLALAKPGSAWTGDREGHPRWRPGYRRDAAVPPTLRADDLMAGRLDVSRLHGRWVLVGLTDPARQARVPGPFGSAMLYPVEHQARALVALLQGDTRRPLPAAAQVLLSMLLAGAGLALGGGDRARGARMPLALCGAMLASLALAAWLASRQLWFAPGGVLGVLLLALLAWTLLALRRLLREHRPVPGLASRARLDAALAEARRTGAPHTLLLLDGGDDRGDACRLAQLLRERARRPGDLAAHLGAGRFVLLLPGTPPAAAGRLLADIREQAIARDLAAPAGHVHACEGAACSCPGTLDVAWPGSPQPAP